MIPQNRINLEHLLKIFLSSSNNDTSVKGLIIDSRIYKQQKEEKLGTKKKKSNRV